MSLSVQPLTNTDLLKVKSDELHLWTWKEIWLLPSLSSLTTMILFQLSIILINLKILETLLLTYNLKYHKEIKVKRLNRIVVMGICLGFSFLKIIIVENNNVVILFYVQSGPPIPDISVGKPSGTSLWSSSGPRVPVVPGVLP